MTAFDLLRLLAAGGAVWFHDPSAAVYIAFFGSALSSTSSRSASALVASSKSGWGCQSPEQQLSGRAAARRARSQRYSSASSTTRPATLLGPHPRYRRPTLADSAARIVSSF